MLASEAGKGGIVSVFGGQECLGQRLGVEIGVLDEGAVGAVRGV